MKAAVYRRFGGPKVVAPEEVSRPEPTGDQVLVRALAASVSASDAARRRDLPARAGRGCLPSRRARKARSRRAHPRVTRRIAHSPGHERARFSRTCTNHAVKQDTVVKNVHDRGGRAASLKLAVSTHVPEISEREARNPLLSTLIEAKW
jgi:hypothetical protein